MVTKKKKEISEKLHKRVQDSLETHTLKSLPVSSGGATKAQYNAEEERLALETAAANLGVTSHKAAQVAELNKNLAALNGEFGLSHLVAKFYISGITYSYNSDKGIVLYAPDKSPVATGYTDVLIALKRLRELAKKHKASSARKKALLARNKNQSKKGYLTNV